ncbi:hypothetical protein KL930_004620 [Ogataea haglerorum]|nr:hypothetical protein KL914_001220 [Ogataea haglerorum]KAG7737182.1 hypothetical protein KL932_004142 [Ogataea haglerorum]KAG7773146.1 hypothetical protein KL930_004620 [Ogataea haglerorum]KAG7780091.1 hypothetical protein KL922_001376 [Ogataea haglerorum]KAG7785242.1 hypothetical protein KL945_004007 [Ogataea haglerorum]
MVLYLALLKLVVLAVIAAAELDDVFPEPLTAANFDNVMSKGFHFVEFFSPHCSHCKALAPIWKEFYDTFHAEAESYDVYINQVDCVASGDLCDREKIFMYPMIRLYGPNDRGNGGKLLASFGRGYERTVEGLTAFVREQAIDSREELLQSPKEISDLMKSADIGAISSANMIEIIAGNIEKPYLVSFWPGTDEELNVDTFSQDVKDNKLFSKCPRCLDFRNLWSMVGRRLSPLIKQNELSVGYLNCKSNENICSSLGMDDLLTDNYDTYDPKIFMFLPSNRGGNKIRYKSSTLNGKQIINWSKRLLDIAKFEDITIADLSKKMKLRSSPFRREDFTEIDVDPTITFIYLYSKETAVAEDFWLLDHLIQPVMDLRSNVRLYKSSDIELMDLAKNQEETLIKYVNQEIADPANQLHFDEEMYTARTLTTYPMLLCFKDDSLVSHVFQSFGPHDIRDFNAVMDFIKVNANPFVEQMTDASRDAIFPRNFNPAIMSKNEKVVLVVTDADDHTQLHKQGYALSQIGHRFHYLKLMNQFEKLKRLRGEKYAKVEMLKAKGKDNVDIIRALREEVPGVFEIKDNNVHLVYVEQSKLKSLSKNLGWSKFNTQKYKPGDIIIVSRFTNNYWDTSLKGQKLTSDTISDTVDVLSVASFKKFPGKGLRSSLSVSAVSTYFVLLMLIGVLILGLSKTRATTHFRSRGDKHRCLKPFFSDAEANAGSGPGLGKVD